MISLASLSLTHWESSHCFALQIKLAKSAGFGDKIHQRPDVLCLTTKYLKFCTAILCMCEGDILPPWAIPPQTSQVKSELLSDARTTMGLGRAVVSFLPTSRNLRTWKPSRDLTHLMSPVPGLTEVQQYPHLSLDRDPMKMQGEKVLKTRQLF